jgi:hypothetical protein
VSNQEQFRCANVVFCLFHELHMSVGLMRCDQEDRFKDSKGRGWGNIMKDGTVNLQHETGAHGNSNPCIKGHLSKLGFLFSRTNILNQCILYSIVLIEYIFLLCSLKNKPLEGAVRDVMYSNV